MPKKCVQYNATYVNKQTKKSGGRDTNTYFYLKRLFLEGYKTDNSGLIWREELRNFEDGRKGNLLSLLYCFSFNPCV